MKPENKPDEIIKSRLFTKDGKPLRILSTSLGLALLANMLLPGISDASSPAAGTANVASGPKLVEWSTEEVKQYFDPSVDWNLPLLNGETGGQDANPQGNSGGAANTGGGSGGTTVINTSSGFGWDDLILYHLLFNRGGSYSSSSWTSRHPTYYSGTGTRYSPKTYSSETFQNKPVAGSSVRPRTKDSTGTITRRSTSSSAGGIGGKSSGLSSSRSGGSHSFGGFGG